MAKVGSQQGKRLGSADGSVKRSALLALLAFGLIFVLFGVQHYKDILITLRGMCFEDKNMKLILEKAARKAALDQKCCVGTKNPRLRLTYITYKDSVRTAQ
jgi:hypothetical protein